MNYKVYQGSELKQTVTSKTAVMNGLQPNRTYEFGVQPNDGNRDGTKVATSVTTRGIRFNIPKTLTVGDTINLRYEEYPLGIIPIGNEPSGMFGGGNKQNLSAKVISTANGSSVVEVAGNVIEVGGDNLYTDTLNFNKLESWYTAGPSGFWKKTTDTYKGLAVVQTTVEWNGLSQYVQVKKGDILTYSAYAKNTSGSGTSTIYWYLNDSPEGSYYTAKATPDHNDVKITDSWQRISSTAVATSDGYLRPRIERTPANTNILQIAGIKVETGDIATPYASFVDGDTFTAQPDGTCALFSEYKALYY